MNNITIKNTPIVPVTGELIYNTDENKILVYDGDDWTKVDQNIMYDYQEMLKGIPIEEIQRFLRKKKLENIEKS